MTSDILAALVAEANVGGRSLWWLSFVDPSPDIPEGEQTPGGVGFLGVCIVAAATPMGAAVRTHALKVNPGGAVQIAGPYPLGEWSSEWCDRLLSWEDIQQMNGDS